MKLLLRFKLSLLAVELTLVNLGATLSPLRDVICIALAIGITPKTGRLVADLISSGVWKTVFKTSTKKPIAMPSKLLITIAIAKKRRVGFSFTTWRTPFLSLSNSGLAIIFQELSILAASRASVQY